MGDRADGNDNRRNNAKVEEPLPIRNLTKTGNRLQVVSKDQNNIAESLQLTPDGNFEGPVSHSSVVALRLPKRIKHQHQASDNIHMGDSSNGEHTKKQETKFSSLSLFEDGALFLFDEEQIMLNDSGMYSEEETSSSALSNVSSDEDDIPFPVPKMAEKEYDNYEELLPGRHRHSGNRRVHPSELRTFHSLVDPWGRRSSPMDIPNPNQTQNKEESVESTESLSKKEADEEISRICSHLKGTDIHLDRYDIEDSSSDEELPPTPSFRMRLSKEVEFYIRHFLIGIQLEKEARTSYRESMAPAHDTTTVTGWRDDGSRSIEFDENNDTAPFHIFADEMEPEYP